MFKDVGKKIKGLAKFCAYVCFIGGMLIALIGLFKYLSDADLLKYASVYGGAGYGYDILTEAGDNAYIGLQMLKYGLFTAITGIISAWPLYGLGQIVDDIHAIRKQVVLEDKKISEAKKEKEEKNEKKEELVLPEL